VRPEVTQQCRKFGQAATRLGRVREVARIVDSLGQRDNIGRIDTLDCGR